MSRLSHVFQFKLRITFITHYAIPHRYFLFFIFASFFRFSSRRFSLWGRPQRDPRRSTRSFFPLRSDLPFLPPALPCLVVSIIPDATSFSNFSRDFRTNTVSSPLSLVEHYRNVHPHSDVRRNIKHDAIVLYFFCTLIFFSSALSGKRCD